MKIRPLIFGLMACVAYDPAQADPSLKFPDGTTLGFEQKALNDSYLLPVGPFADGKMQTLMAKGDINKQVWKTPASGIKTLDIITPLRKQLEVLGYSVVYECETRECGGFDFRFQADVVAEPDMHVDLGDFRYLAAQKLSLDGDAYVGVLVSRGLDKGYVQLTSIGAASLSADAVNLSSKLPSDLTADDAQPLAEQLATNGSAVLEGLEFVKGSATLSGDVSTELQEVSDYLAADKARTIVLVGHTDAEGSLEGNIALSKRRAASVKQSLVDTFGVSNDQVSAEGVGFLAPRASNATEAGREKNRRVEVVLTRSE